MSLGKQMAKNFRDVINGGNWTWVNMKETLADVTWQQAITQVYSFNTIATLVNHTMYYVSGVLTVLQGGQLTTKDELSFTHPPINSQQDWEGMLNKAWADVEQFALLVEQLSDEKFFETFTDEKYGNYYRNIAGIIEHNHYHLGQIVLIKKILAAEGK